MNRKVVAVWVILVMVFGFVVIVDTTMDIIPTTKGATLYVGGTGGGNFSKIQWAIENASDGDTVYVYNGTYFENVVVDKILNLTGENASTTIIDGDATGDVVHLDADYVNITGFTIHNSGNTQFPDYDSGIKFDNVQHCKIINNIFSDNSYGIYLMSSSNNSIDTNDFSLNTGNGIYLVSSSYNNIFNNELTFGWYLINLDESSYNNLTDNNISNSHRGLVIWESTYNTILNNEILNNNWGIYNVYAPYNRIINNNISYNSDGIQLGTYSNHTEITGNNILSNGNALEVSYSSDIIIDGNNISDSYNGCNFRLTSNVSFTNNSVISTRIYGFLLDSSQNFNISNNYFFNDSIFIQGDTLEDFNSHDISPDNSVNGKPLIFHKDRSGLTIEGENIGQVILVNCTSMKVRNVAINKTDIGMEVAFSDNITVKNSRFTHNLHGLYLYSLSNSSIGNNNISFQGEIGIIMEFSSINIVSDNQLISNDDGILVEYSANNSIIRNRIVNCDYGIRMLHSQFNNITNNIFLYNYWTVYIQSSQNNIIMQNNVSFGEWLGIYIKSSSNNHIYHNNIIDNENQAYDDRSDNFWDNGYPSGGNFWSDYSGSDDFSGPNQDIPGADEIGDTDYYIDGNSIDNYPLMTPIENVSFQKPVYNIDKGTYYDQIQIAHDDADADNTIVVSRGVFKENVTINKTITLRGENKDESVIAGYGINSVVNILADWVNISGFSINGSGNLTEDAGLKLTNANYCTISEICIKENNKHGIYLKDSSYNNITFNYLESNNGSGLKLVDSSENNISYNYFTFNNEYGIHLSGSSPPSLLSENNTIFHNNIENNTNQSLDDTNFKNSWDIGYPQGGNYWSDYIGMDEFSGPNQNLPGPDEIGDTNYSIDSDSYDRYPLIRRFENILKPICNVDKDTYYDKIQDALDDSDSGNTILVKNGTYYENLVIEKTITLIGKDRNGTFIDASDFSHVILVWADWVNISGLGIKNARYNAGILLLSSNNTIDSNNITDTDEGICLGYPNNIITNNIFSQNYYQGLYVGDTSDNIIMNNQFQGYIGIELDHLSHSNTIISNHFINSSIRLYYSSNNTILDNHFTGQFSRIDFYSSKNNTLMGNCFQTSGIYIDGYEVSHFNSHEISLDNIANGNPIYYYKDSSDLIIDSIPIGQLILANCSNTTVRNLRIDNVYCGIEAAFSRDSIITNNNISVHGNGIFMIGSSDINIENNHISNSAGGVRIRSSMNNLIQLNNISMNRIGIGFDSPPEDGNQNNIVLNNDISLNEFGITLFRSKDNLIINNNIYHNQYVGISITGSSPNSIEGNNISHSETGFEFTQSYNAVLTGNTIFNNSLEFLFSESNYNIFHHNNIIDTDIRIESFWSYDNEWDDGDGEGNYWSDYNGTDTDGDGVGNTQVPHHRDYYPLMLPYPLGVPPEITMVSPNNNAFIQPGFQLIFNITDTDLNYANYSINSEPDLPFISPYMIYTDTWLDGIYSIKISAIDDYGNTASETFHVIVDTINPIIILDAPTNNSFCKAGTLIQFSILEPNLKNAKYSVDNENNLTLAQPYDIPTSGWIDGTHIIYINAWDEIGNSNFSWFVFTYDSTKPEIILKSPDNNSVIAKGVILNFTVDDSNLKNVTYSVNGGDNISALEEFSILTIEWSDGEYYIEINAEDSAGNSKSSWFIFTIDSTPPIVWIDSSLNHSTIHAGFPIKIETSSSDIRNMSYSINDGGFILMEHPYSINTSSWPHGPVVLNIKVTDVVGNQKIYSFEINVDAISPFIVSTNIPNDSEDLEIDISVLITFNEPMNITNTESNIQIFPNTNLTFQWNQNSTVLTISFGQEKLKENTAYSLVILSQLSDLNGNPMQSDYLLNFTTKKSPPSVKPTSWPFEGISQFWVSLFVVMIILVSILCIYLFVRFKKIKGGTNPKQEEII